MKNEYLVLLMALGWIFLMLVVVLITIWLAARYFDRLEKQKGGIVRDINSKTGGKKSDLKTSEREKRK